MQDTPTYPPSRYEVVLEEPFGKTKKFYLNSQQKLFLILDDPNSSFVSAVYAIGMGILVIVAAVFYIISTDPNLRETPDSCRYPACEDDDILCPNEVICAPQPPYYFHIVETFCISVFAFDYILRISLVPLMPARLAGVLSPNWDKDSRNANLPDPDYHPSKVFMLYVTSFMCIVDLVTVIPFIVELVTHKPTSFSVVRLLRLIRLYKLVRGTAFASSVEAFLATIQKSLLALSVLVLFTSLGSIIFSAIIFYLERGDFTVNSDYPDGAYLRPGLTSGQSAPSPFVSIPAALYWSIVTVTTVGYGDLYPTTSAGRFFTMIWMFFGVLLIALPVSVLGSNFSQSLAEIQGRVNNKQNKNLVSNTLNRWKSSIINPLTSANNHSSHSDSSTYNAIDRSLLTPYDRDRLPSDSSDHLSLQEIKKDNQNNNNNNNISPNNFGFDGTQSDKTCESYLCSTCPKCSYQFSSIPPSTSPSSSLDRLKYLSKQIDLLIQEFQEEKKKTMNINLIENE